MTYKHTPYETYVDVELPVAIVNMTGKSKAIKRERIHQRTRAQMGVVIPFDYTHLAPISDDDDNDCSVVATSQASSSIQGEGAEVHT